MSCVNCDWCEYFRYPYLTATEALGAFIKSAPGKQNIPSPGPGPPIFSEFNVGGADSVRLAWRTQAMRGMRAAAAYISKQPPPPVSDTLDHYEG